jgi:hypothetical protein
MATLYCDLFIYSFIAGHSSCWVLVVTKGCYEYLCTIICMDELGHMACLLKKLLVSFPTWLYHFTSHDQCVRDPIPPCPCQHLLLSKNFFQQLRESSAVHVGSLPEMWPGNSL